jgi:hypothetical protein
VAGQHGGGQQIHTDGCHSAATAAATTGDVTWQCLTTETASASQQQTSAGKYDILVKCMRLSCEPTGTLPSPQRITTSTLPSSQRITTSIAIASQLNPVTLSYPNATLYILISSQLDGSPPTSLSTRISNLNCLCVSYCPMRVTWLTNLILLAIMTINISAEEYTPQSLSLCTFLNSLMMCPLLEIFPNHPQSVFYLTVQQQVSHPHKTTVPYILRSPSCALYKLQTNKFKISEGRLQSQARPCQIYETAKWHWYKFLLKYFGFPVIIPPTLNTRVHLNTNLIRRTSGQCQGTLWTIQCCPPSHRKSSLSHYHHSTSSSLQQSVRTSQVPLTVLRISVSCHQHHTSGHFRRMGVELRCVMCFYTCI